MTAPPSRRQHNPPAPVASVAQSPVPAFARSPHSRKREPSTRDVGTQYTPPGFPPTYRAPAQGTSPSSNPLPATATAYTERGETSAAAAVTEPPEPNLRVDPQPAVLPHAPPGRKTPRDSGAGEPRQREHTVRQDGQRDAQDEASLSKRPRSLNQNIKVMPLKYETCDVKDLGVLVSDMLMELVRLNDNMPLRDGQLTRFHSRYYLHHPLAA